MHQTYIFGLVFSSRVFIYTRDKFVLPGYVYY